MINFLLSTEIIPLCLRTMEIGTELSKTVATFIVQKILLDDVSGPRGLGPRKLGVTAGQGRTGGNQNGASGELGRGGRCRSGRTGSCIRSCERPGLV